MRASLPLLQRSALTALFCFCCVLLAWPRTGHAQPSGMADRTRACTACHGEQGQAGHDGYYPRLAGKPAGYLVNQLKNFQQGRRQYSPMQHLIAPLSDDYLRAMADYFASLHVPYPAPVKMTAAPDIVARGKTLVLQGDAAQGLPACAACHGQALTGLQPGIPGLLGLPRDYLNAQLGGWQTGQRKAHAPDCMATIAKRLSDADVNAISQWLSSQPVPANSTAVSTRPARSTQLSPLPECGSAP